MAEDEEHLSTDEKVQRSVGRLLANTGLALVLLVVLGAWGALGVYTLEPGQAAVLLTLGRHSDTVTTEGLHFTLPPDRLHAAFHGHLNELVPVDGAYELAAANALWAQRDKKFLPEYTSTLTTHYGAEARSLDFAGAPDAARRTVRAAVAAARRMIDPVVERAEGKW